MQIEWLLLEYIDEKAAHANASKRLFNNDHSIMFKETGFRIPGVPDLESGIVVVESSLGLVVFR